jgi:hypothetical protein
LQPFWQQLPQQQRLELLSVDLETLQQQALASEQQHKSCDSGVSSCKSQSSNRTMIHAY